MRKIAGLTLLLIISTLLPARGDIYRRIDEEGVVHFTNAPRYTSRPSRQGWNFYRKETRFAATSAGRGAAARSGSAPLIHAYQELIRANAQAYRLEEALVKAVIKVESNYNPLSRSPKGAQGLMQLIPETARLVKVGNPYDPAENIRGGSSYLRLMLDKFGGDLDLALAAYNAGPGAVQRHGGIPPFEETRQYVQLVRHYLERYRRSGENLL